MKETVIAVSVLILGVMLLRRLCKGRISAGIQYMLWLIVAVRLIMPGIALIFPDVVPESSFSIMNAVNKMERAAQDYIYDGEVPGQIEVPAGNLPFITTTSADGPTAVFYAGRITWTWGDIFRAIWYIGMAASCLWIVLVNIRFAECLRKSRKRYEKEDFRLPVYLTKEISSPCLYGAFFRQAVYIPEDMIEDEEKVRHILTHEYCHYKHRDVFWSVLRCALTAVYWFHPLVWMAAVLSKQDCELACDEAAIKMLGEEERIAYGKTLLVLISRKTKASDLICAATTMTAGSEGMKERICRIANKPRRLAAVLLLTIAAAVMMITSTFTKSKEYPDGVYVLEGESAKTVTTECFQVTFPDDLVQKVYFGGANGTDIIVYHKDSDREIGRFSMMFWEEAVEIAKERDVVMIGEYGSNGALVTAMHGYEGYPEEDVQGISGVLGADSAGEISGVPGTDSNTGETTYLYEDIASEEWPSDEPAENAAETPELIPIPEEKQDYLANEQILMPDRADGQTHSFTPSDAESGEEDGLGITYHDYEEESVDEEDNRVYLPDEKITTTHISLNPEAPCYLYIPADNTDAAPDMQAEISKVSQELAELTDSVRVLFLSRESVQEALQTLVENRTPYVGDASRTSRIAGVLPGASGLSYQYVELETATQPYAVTIYYKLEEDNPAQTDPDTLLLEAALMFASIENLEECNIQISDIEDRTDRSPYEESGYEKITYERSHMEALFGSLYPCSETEEAITELYNRILIYLDEKN